MSGKKNIFPRHYQIVKPYLKGTDDEMAIVRTLIHLLENLILTIVVKDRFLPEEEIREEISIVLRGCVK